jgi:uncharacterized protein (TIGR02118 family)
VIKFVGPMQRLDRMSPEDFRSYYLEQHTRNASGLPGNVKYVSGIALRDANGGDPPFDAVYEGYWESLDALREAFVSPEWDAARQDHPKVVGGRMMLIVEEHDLLEPPPASAGKAKYLAFLSRRDRSSREQFVEHWLGAQVPLVLALPGLLGYRASTGLCSANGDSLLRDVPDAPQFDGVAELWFDDLAAFDAAFASDEWDALRRDTYQHLAMGKVQVVVEEHLVFDHTTHEEAGTA